MIEETISAPTAQRYYDRLGRGHDLADFYERKAHRRARALLNVQPGHRVLVLGVGTGKGMARLLGDATTRGHVVGVDLSRTMLGLTQARTGGALVQADACTLPLASGCFDRVFSAYMLDLIPAADLPGILAEMRRVLRPDGRVVVLSLTEGVGPFSRATMGLWQAIYGINPALCGGCRPLRLAPWLDAAGFAVQHREVVVEVGIPSEVVSAAIH